MCILSLPHLTISLKEEKCSPLILICLTLAIRCLPLSSWTSFPLRTPYSTLDSKSRISLRYISLRAHDHRWRLNRLGESGWRWLSVGKLSLRNCQTMEVFSFNEKSDDATSLHFINQIRPNGTVDWKALF